MSEPFQGKDEADVIDRRTPVASLSIRIDLDPDGRIGPGKIKLLETIAREGSISAAGRAMDMSYRRAWDLVDEIGKVCGQPVIASQTGGKHGGGAKLTAFGEELIARYRAIEKAANKAARAHLDALQRGARGVPQSKPSTSAPPIPVEALAPRRSVRRT